MKILSQGAEAILYIEENEGRKLLVKERVEKKYRVKQIDQKLRKERTNTEVSLLDRAARNGVSVPKVFDATDFKIVMEFLEGDKLKDTLNQKKESELKSISKQIGSTVAKLHSAGLVHGDLTTSNMIFHKDCVYLIDFGLGKNSAKVEDQATDLYLLYEAVKSTHFKVLDIVWKGFLDGYLEYAKHKEVLKRFEEISKRRRYKGD